MTDTIHRLTDHAHDSGTYQIDYAILGPDGGTVTLDSLVWSLRIRSGEIVNNRNQVVINPPSASGVISLHGADIAYSVGSTRYLTLEATYTDPVLGTLPLTSEYVFSIDNYLGIAEDLVLLESESFPDGILRGLSGT
ncbi:hypothetical protein COW49_03550, partial [Candidatus Kaiserbacteria bacterium CG17_big_fil_post_rev_8_21_14_2_50_51_7]